MTRAEIQVHAARLLDEWKRMRKIIDSIEFLDGLRSWWGYERHSMD